jgi:hypothetical protein
MDAKSYRSTSGSTTDAAEVEAYLKSTLMPISPRPEFVQELRKRLEYTQSEPPSAFSVWKMSITVLLVGVGGLLVIFTILRMMVTQLRSIRESR